MFKSIKKCSWGVGVWVIVWGDNEANVKKAARTISVMVDGGTVTLPVGLEYAYIASS